MLVIAAVIVAIITITVFLLKNVTQENISYSIDGYGMSAEVSGEVLYISSDDVLFGNCNSAGEVKIYIPRDTMLEEINMDLGVGDLNLESINVSETVNINAGTGDIDIRDMKAETLNIDCGAGDVELKNMDTAKLDIDCGCGDTSIEMAGREQDYAIDLSAAMGDIEIGNVSYSGLGTDVLLNEGASKNIFIDCALGSVDVSFEE